MEIIQISLSLIIKSLILSARWASLSRRNQLFNSQGDEELQTIINALNDKIEKQEVELELLRKQIKKSNTKPRYTIREKLMVLWYMEYFDVPRCQISKRLGIAKSTLYRWLKEFDSIIKTKREPVNKTPNELARLVWTIHKSNPDWGRHRI